MEKKIKSKVKYEFYQFNGTLGVFVTQLNLKLEHPASIKFVCVGPVGTGARINNLYQLSTLIDYVSGVAQLPYELVLENNQDEIDVTNYSLQIFGQCAVFVVCKYYIND